MATYDKNEVFTHVKEFLLSERCLNSSVTNFEILKRSFFSQLSKSEDAFSSLDCDEEDYFDKMEEVLYQLCDSIISEWFPFGSKNKTSVTCKKVRRALALLLNEHLELEIPDMD